MSDVPPSLFRLIADGLVSKPTAAALLPRLEPAPTTHSAFFEEETFGILVALAARLRPRTFRPTALELALRIDARLQLGKTDGWRYDALPSDGDAYSRGLRALNAEAVARYETPLAELDGASADTMIMALQRGETRAVWDVPPIRFLEDLLAEVVALAYAQPCAQAAIGYVGYADAKGWTRIGLNRREDWER